MKIMSHRLILITQLSIFLLFFSCTYKNITTSPEKFPVTISSDSNGIVCGAGTYQVAEGDSLVISVCHLSEHYKFKNWIITSGADSCILWNKFDDTTVIKNVIGPVSVKAMFEIEEYTLSINQPSGGGKISTIPEALNDKYDTQQQITLTATADTGWEFVRWNGLVSTSNPATITIKCDTIISAMFQTIAAPSKVICVKYNALQNGGGTIGRNWVDAYRTLNEALSVAQAGDSIWVASGTYTPASAIALKRGITLVGGFTGNESNVSQRNWIQNKVIINGSALTGYQVVNATAADSNVTIDGFRITNTNQNGIYLRASSIIRNCIFSLNNPSNTVGTVRSAIRVLGNNSSILSCVFTQNSGSEGTCININSGVENTKIGNSIFAGNDGPAISNAGNSTQILKSTIVNNASDLSATPGGIYNGSTTMLLQSCLIWGNTNVGDNQGTQINSTGYVDYCCIQDCNIDQKGILSRNTNTTQWQISNTYLSPGFSNTTIPSSDVDWFDATGNSIAPFIPSASSAKSELSEPLLPRDIRGVRRNSPYEIGVYKRM